MKNKSHLPPTIEVVKNGKIVWRKNEEVDYKTLGFLLACHLIIEHYMTEALKTTTWWEKVQWEAARLTFSQKIAMLPARASKIGSEDMMPCIKHLNSLRNKFGHDIAFRLADKDLVPFTQLLKRVSQPNEMIPTGKIEILDKFTGMACFWLVSYISSSSGLAKLALNRE
jgi:hypothetical protein